MPGHKAKRNGLAKPGNGSWPPFERGNPGRAVHGAATDQLVSPLAGTFIAELMATAPGYLDDPSFRYAVVAWAKSEAMLLLYETWMDQLPEDRRFSAKGAQQPAVLTWGRLEEGAARARSRLGLDPASRVKIGKALTSQGYDIARMAMMEAEQQHWPDGLDADEDALDPV